MRHLKIIVISFIAIVAVVFIGVKIRSYYLFLKEPVTPLFKALPENTSVVIRTRSFYDFLEAVNNSAITVSLAKNEYFRLINSIADSVDKVNKLKNLLTSGEVYFALTGDNSKGLLIGVNIGKTSQGNINKLIKDLLKSDYTLEKINKDMMKISGVKDSGYYFVKNGIFMISPDSIILSTSLNSLLSEKSLNLDESFVKLFKSTGKSSTANLLINNNLLSSAIWTSKSGLLNNTPFTSWSSFDIILKKGEISLGGFTLSNGTNPFKGQVPVKFDAYRYYPTNTAFALSISLSDQALYTRSFVNKDTLHVRGYDAMIRQNSNEIFKPGQHVESWIGNTVSLICTNNYFKGNKKDYLVLIDSRNKDSASYYLKPFIEPINDSLGKMHFTEFTSDLWGSLFSLNEDSYCLITKNIVAFSPSRSLINGFSVNNSTSKELKQLENEISPANSIFIYIKPRLSASWIKRQNTNSNFTLIDFIAESKSIGIEYKVDEDLQYTHAWMELSPTGGFITDKTLRKPNNETELDSTIEDHKQSSDFNGNTIDIELPDDAYQPKILNGKNNKQKRIAVLTKRGKISVYNNSGKLLWSVNLKENIVDKILEADYYKNGNNHYILLSSKKMYILDSDGKQIKDSPIKLPGKLAGGISLFDYDNKKDYRLLYIGTDSKIYNITLKGTELPDWQKPTVDGVGSIQFIRSAGKDYLIYSNNGESLKIFDRRGRERIKIKERIVLSANTEIYSNRTNSKGIFLTVNKSGDMVYINSDGKITSSSFIAMGKDVWFQYIDFNTDGSMDFLYSTGKNISAYTKMRDIITEFKTHDGDYGTPYIYSSSLKEKWIFVRNKENDEVVGFNNKGKKYSQKFTSTTDPVIFNPGGSYPEILITTKDNKITLTELIDL